MDFDLAGKVAIVTGASRVLCYQMALALAGQGVKVLAVARSIDDLKDLQSRDPERIAVSQCDMLDAAAVEALPEQARELFGSIDIVVNNAGIAPATPILQQDFDEWQRVFAVKVTAPAILCRAAGEHMVTQGSGKIINVASTSGILGKASLAAYSSSKGAVLQFTKSLAAEWAKFGVQVNAIAPGAFKTDAQAKVMESPEILKRRVGKIPARRMAESSEIGALTCYLASAQSDFVTGSVMVIDGGESSKL